MPQPAAVADEASTEQPQPTSGRQPSHCDDGVALEHTEEKKILGLSEEQIVKIVLVTTVASYLGWLLQSLS